MHIHCTRLAVRGSVVKLGNHVLSLSSIIARAPRSMPGKDLSHPRSQLFLHTEHTSSSFTTTTKFGARPKTIAAKTPQKVCPQAQFMDSNLYNKQEQNHKDEARATPFSSHKRKLSAAHEEQITSATSASKVSAISTPKPNTSSKRTKASKMSSSILIDFYDDNLQGRDAHGRTLQQILAWSDDKLEASHNWVQWVFPLPEGSLFSVSVPLITREVMEAFRGRSDLRSQLRRSFDRAMGFYGFEVTIQSEGTTSAKPTFPPGATSQKGSFTLRLTRGTNWRAASRNWARPADHNHLRLSRIIRSLRVLGLQKEADALFKALQEVFDDPAFNIRDSSMKFWRRAAQRPLYIAPDDGEVDWLKEWEEEQEKLKKGAEAARKTGKGEEDDKQNDEVEGKVENGEGQTNEDA